MKGLIKVVVFSLLPNFAFASVLNAVNLDPRAANICGKTGYDRGGSNYDYDGSGKFSTLVDCSKRC